MNIVLKNICKGLGGRVIYDDFSVEFKECAISCILGPSGCGKTTLLNMVGGLILPDSGSIEGVEGKIFSYIFQEPRLLPWKTVRQNIEFVIEDSCSIGAQKSTHNIVTGKSIKCIGADRKIRDFKRERADALIRQVELQGFADYYPSQLSGGMKQRVSIARAFACKSDIILMDEPLSGLDVSLKQNLMHWFSELWKSEDCGLGQGKVQEQEASRNARRTVLFVTHDVDEARMLGNITFVLSNPPVRIIKDYFHK